MPVEDFGELPPAIPPENVRYGGFDYTITYDSLSGWQAYRGPISIRTMSGEIRRITGPDATPLVGAIHSYRCGICETEYPMDLIGYYVTGNTQNAYYAAQACCPPCEVCMIRDCGIDHVMCEWCDMFDCEIGDELDHTSAYCDYCDRYNCGRSHVIQSYGYKPRPEWLGGSGAPYYLGFELEVTSYDESADARRLMEWANQHIGQGSIYCKEDSSVCGFEIVSHPMTPEFFETIDWRGFFAQVRQNSNGSTREEPDGHGLHVHVSRTAFENPLTLARWIYLWNARQNRQAATALCRRRSDEWAAFTDNDVRNVSRTAKAERNWRTMHYYPTYRRYSLINLTNSETVEFRGFRSTRRADEFRRSIRSIYKSVDYVRSMQPCHSASVLSDYELSRAVA